MFTYKSLLTAIFFSFFLYCEYLGFSVKFINTIFALMGIILLFTLSKKELFTSGFLVGVLWFYWVSYSFIYYELIYLIPIVVISIGIIYGVLFYFIALFNNLFYRLSYLFLLSFIEPFGFNWFKMELPFINSYFGTSKIEYFIILISVALFLHYQDRFKKQSVFSFSVVLVSLYFYNISNTIVLKEPKLKIYKYETSISPSIKWKKEYRAKILDDNYNAIKYAIAKQNELIILPETAFPLVLNGNYIVHEKLLELSYDISIVTGALYHKDGLFYNSTYFYNKGKVEVANKVVLVPFGEAVPFPEKIRKFINDMFYNGAKDYETAKSPTTFIINDVKFRNAICYEITTDKVYDNLDTKYVISISNNAWFTPSIQPSLQNLLMQYYQNKYNVYYINVTNKLNTVTIY